ncbi:pentatricopeptide repeat-containing protein At3g53170 isoform X1 [Actinidia eriantha]|uniref:pentatricopeptide repeat-containing protein At3g53170 isoform X1 n=1 Tax=Actinidia eriantha TaxID=165200 RepID=UPI00258F4506|nr:pentatricopeptide repeat-containing protein At3g53170 isoform X1 [Actinidia eriantha]XP_057498125.1 pentatricopeptide repeat-containing protein At3g53170 isoform X1 [Actinidia eriantha]XP_057498126.1 pentatricopeptide repeat-containing protein At3g53170 isoform X1 [Actinidia eriantha]
MNLQLIDSVNLRWSSSFVVPTTCSTKVLTDHSPSPPPCPIKAAKKSAKNRSQGLHKEPKKDLSRILRTEAAIKAIERKANSNKYHRLWPKAVLDALDDAIREKRWESALKIFSLLRKQHWYEPRGQTYTKLLVMLGKCRQPKQASLLFEIMRSDGLEPTLDVYTALVSTFGFSGLLDEAFRTVDVMKSVSDCTPDVYTYSILINCCTKLRRFDLIEGILAEMSQLRVKCSAVTYNTIIDGYGKAELFELMEKSLKDMIESGTCPPDVFTFNSFIGAYGNCGNIKEMEKWFDEFQLMGLSPDTMTFNILIRSYGKAGMYEKMDSVMEFMRKRFYSPTIVTYNIVIETFGMSGNIEKMDEFFLKMKHQGMKPNRVTYCSLVSAYSKAGLLNKVDSIMRQVENSDVVLDTPFFNCIISAYGQAGEIKKMDELFVTMKERNCKPDNITLATMIQAYKAQGMIEAAEDLQNKIIADEDNSAGTKLISC